MLWTRPVPERPGGALAQNLLVMKLREREAESQGIVEFGANEVAGMTQHDLVTWYFDFQAERCAKSVIAYYCCKV